MGKAVEESVKSPRGRDPREREREREKGVKFGKVGERGRGINSKHDMWTLKKVTQQSQLSTRNINHVLNTQFQVSKSCFKEELDSQ